MSGRTVLWPERGINRGVYLTLGIVLTALKYNLDRMITYRLTGELFYPFHYWMPGDVFNLFSSDPESERVLLPLLFTAVPFAAIGVVLTLHRLRSVGFSPWTAIVFFIPFVNILLFLLLAVLPPREPGAPPPKDERWKRFLARVVPRSRRGSAMAAIGITTIVTLGLTLLFASTLGSYGWGLFIGVPFFLGFFSTLLHSIHEPRSFGSCVNISLLTNVLLGGLLLALAIEGIICILMALPIAIPLSLVGTTIAYFIQKRHHGRFQAEPSALGMLVLLPLLMGAEWAARPEPPATPIRTAVEIDAPPEAVWDKVVSFSELPPPHELIFRAGVAHPIKAEIHGRGVGAVRHCVFSTGPFVEPIEVWDEPRLLKFSVIRQPPTMEEWTPYPNIRAPHLEGAFVSQGGQFKLTPLPGGRTRLEGTSWYRQSLWPEAYWKLWSDAIVHTIHLRVLRHIKQRAEAGLEIE